MRRGHVAILGFTYAEHARCWRLAGHRVTVEETLEAAAGADCVIVTNPNNPDGRQIEPERLVGLAERLVGRGGLLVVDEAFADVTPSLSVAGWVGKPGLCVLRSFGKFFGLAGLRLGFALGSGDLVRRLEDHLGPWAVAGPALEIGAGAMGDVAWSAATRVRLADAARELDGVLESQGLAVIGGPTCSGWPGQRGRRTCSSIWAGAASLSAVSTRSRTGCASACRRTMLHGNACVRLSHHSI